MIKQKRAEGGEIKVDTVRNWQRTFLEGSMANNGKVANRFSTGRHRHGRFTTSCKIIARI